MPKLDGVSTLKGLKENPETRVIPVIILTNLDTSDEITKSFKEGSTDYLIKVNYTLEHLAERIEKAFKNI